MYWWVFSLFSLVFGWIYSGALCIVLTSAPIVCMFWCYYRMQMSDINRDTNMGNVPFARGIIERLAKQDYG